MHMQRAQLLRALLDMQLLLKYKSSALPANRPGDTLTLQE